MTLGIDGKLTCGIEIGVGPAKCVPDLLYPLIRCHVQE